MRKEAGFTLIELIVAIAIASVLLGLAVPSFRGMIESAQRRQAATDFYSSLARARSEAIARNRSVSICVRDLTATTTPSCASNDNRWQNGWIVYPTASPTTPLEVHEGLADGFTLGGVTSPLEFRESGRVGTRAEFSLCKGAADSKRRLISVSPSGRVALEIKDTCAA